MDIYFCDVCCARVNASHLSRGHGARNADVIVCGSCLEKGHGAELLLEAGKLEKVGAAPRLAGSEVLDAPRDRAVTMKNIDTATGDLDLGNDEDATLGTEEELDELQVSLESDAQADDLKLDSDLDDEPIDLATDRDLSEINDIEEPEPDLESVEDINVVDIDDVQDDEDIESDGIESDNASADDIDDDALNFEAADGEDLSEAAVDEEEEPRPESSHISADDVVDDLDDSGVHAIPDENQLEDADDGVHTDSYSADELAAIKRLADKEKRKKTQSSVPSASAKKDSAPRKASSTSSRRSTATSGRAKTKTSGRKKTSSRQKTSTAKSSPQKSASKSRKTSTRAKAAKPGMPKPMLISFITIPIIIVIFVMLIPESKPIVDGPIYDDNVTGLTTMSNDVRNFANDAYNNGDLAKLYEAQNKIREVMAKRDAVVSRMEAAGTYSDSQFDKALRPFRKLMQLERALRDKIEETKSRQ